MFLLKLNVITIQQHSFIILFDSSPNLKYFAHRNYMILCLELIFLNIEIIGIFIPYYNFTLSFPLSN